MDIVVTGWWIAVYGTAYMVLHAFAASGDLEPSRQSLLHLVEDLALSLIKLLPE